MQLLDVLAALLVLASAVAFGLGATALARSSDVEALYWLVVGVVSVRAGVALAKPEASA